MLESIPLQISSKLTFEELSALASSNVKTIDNFILDGFTEETLPLIAEILPKTEDLTIQSDSTQITKLLSEIASPPAKRLLLFVSLPNLPSFPNLWHLYLSGSAGFANLARHSESLKNVESLRIVGTKNVVFHENTSNYQKLEKISLGFCEFVDLGNFYNKNVKEIMVSRYDKISTRRAMFHKNAANGYFLTDRMDNFQNLDILDKFTIIALLPLSDQPSPKILKLITTSSKL
jgi:hypothetical protein